MCNMYKYAYMCVCVCVCMYVHVYFCVRGCVSACMCGVSMHVCKSVYEVCSVCAELRARDPPATLDRVVISAPFVSITAMARKVTVASAIHYISLLIVEMVEIGDYGH